MKNSIFFYIANAIDILYCDLSLEFMTKAKAWEHDNLFKKCLWIQTHSHKWKIVNFNIAKWFSIVWFENL
jgi:hypothetical protein